MNLGVYTTVPQPPQHASSTCKSVFCVFGPLGLSFVFNFSAPNIFFRGTAPFGCHSTITRSAGVTQKGVNRDFFLLFLFILYPAVLTLIFHREQGSAVPSTLSLSRPYGPLFPPVISDIDVFFCSRPCHFQRSTSNEMKKQGLVHVFDFAENRTISGRHDGVVLRRNAVKWCLCWMRSDNYR